MVCRGPEGTLLPAPQVCVDALSAMLIPSPHQRNLHHELRSGCESSPSSAEMWWSHRIMLFPAHVNACLSYFDKLILFMLACVRLSHKDTPGRGPYAACYAETKRSCITGVARGAMKWIAGKLVSYLRGVSLHGDHKTSAPVPLFYRPMWNVWSLGKPTEPCYHTQWTSGLLLPSQLWSVHASQSAVVIGYRDLCPYCLQGKMNYRRGSAWR